MSLRPSNNLNDLMGELERRMTGEASLSGLHPDLAASIPDADTYVVVLFDGLGIAQLDHPDATVFRESSRGVLHSPFPTTTSVALSTVATGLAPGEHGLVAHLMWLPDLDKVVNTLKWVDLSGRSVSHAYGSVLPRPNLWERLRDHGIEPITVQPAAFQGSPLTRMLYRGARFEPAWDDRDLVEATVQLSGEGKRFIFTYVWQIDFAGHVHGLDSSEFAEAMRYAAGVWQELASRIPPGVALIGIADHGLIEYGDSDKLLVREPRFDSLRFGGDTRGVHLWGSRDLIEDFASLTGGDLIDPATLYQGTLAVPARSRVGDALVMAPKGKVILPPGFDKRLRAYHGGLDPREVEIPLLIG